MRPWAFGKVHRLKQGSSPVRDDTTTRTRHGPFPGLIECNGDVSPTDGEPQEDFIFSEHQCTCESILRSTTETIFHRPFDFNNVM
jgi:hypothetical protein